MNKKELTAARDKKIIEVSAGIMRYVDAAGGQLAGRLTQTTLGDLTIQVSGKSVATDLDMAWVVSCLALIADLRIGLADGTVVAPYTVDIPPPSLRYAADTLIAIRVADITHLTPQDMQDAIRDAITARCKGDR